MNSLINDVQQYKYVVQNTVKVRIKEFIFQCDFCDFVSTNVFLELCFRSNEYSQLVFNNILSSMIVYTGISSIPKLCFQNVFIDWVLTDSFSVSLFSLLFVCFRCCMSVPVAVCLFPFICACFRCCFSVSVSLSFRFSQSVSISVCDSEM